MCVTCGCGGPVDSAQTAHGADENEHEHVLPDGTRVVHRHGHVHESEEHARQHEHEHAPPHAHGDGHDHDQHHDHQHDHHHHHDPAPQGHAHAHEHALPDGTRVVHAHDHGHRPAGTLPSATVLLEQRILAKNDALAARNRGWLAGRETLALNLVSSPGAGKTTLLERTIREVGAELAIHVIEGDQATSADGDRIRAAGAPVVQINTGTGCHLEADMIARALDTLVPPLGATVLIENVGNLVCPALFDLGEHAKVVVFSVTEGEDKPIKYPHMFGAADLLLLSKVDLLPHLDFDVELALVHARTVNPKATVLRVSARTGEGMDAWYRWLRERRAAVLAAS